MDKDPYIDIEYAAQQIALDAAKAAADSLFIDGENYVNPKNYATEMADSYSVAYPIAYSILKSNKNRMLKDIHVLLMGKDD